jgi:galactose mutarotase-like enzyme
VGDTIRLAAGNAAVCITLRGAEPVAWSIAGRDLLWQVDPAYWAKTSPILFPIVGRATNDTIRIEGHSYAMGVHGFAALRDFELQGQAVHSARLVLRDDAETRESFPFAFELEVLYQLEPAGLSAAFTVRNPDERPLPYAVGFHPGFGWPFAGGGREDYRVEFEKAEKPQVPAITKDGFFLQAFRAVPLDDRALPLSDELFAGEALCFLNAKSRWLRFIAPDGAAISMAMENFPHFALWSRRGAPFVCLEAWTGHGDPEGFERDIAEKPSMRLLAPGSEARHAVRMVYQAAR